LPHWVLATAACVAAVILETLCAGRDPGGALKTTRQPRWALPFPVWVAIGLVYYAACFFSLWRLLPRRPEATTCIVLLVAIMAANGFWNYFFFRRRDFRVSFWYQVPYLGLAVAFLWCVARVDAVVAAIFGAYFVYMPFAAVWVYQVWKINEEVRK